MVAIQSMGRLSGDPGLRAVACDGASGAKGGGLPGKVWVPQAPRVWLTCPDDLGTAWRSSLSLVPVGLWASGWNRGACLAGLGLSLC